MIFLLLKKTSGAQGFILFFSFKVFFSIMLINNALFVLEGIYFEN